MSNSTQGLKNLVDEMISEGIRLDLLSVLRRAKDQGIMIDMDEVRWFLDRVDRLGTFLCPEFIPIFIASYLKESAPKSILDTWAGTGGILAPLVRILEPSVAVGLSRVMEEQEIARLLHDDMPIDWRLGEPLLLLDDIDVRFDVVVGCLPWGSRPESLTLTLDGTPVELRDDLDNLLMLKASMLLESEGVGFFLASPRFMLQRGSQAVRANLLRLGLFVDAALALPCGTFSPMTSMGGLLVVIRRQKPARLFVGELTSDPTSSDVLLNNLKARKEGKAPQLGSLVDPQSFRSFEAVVAQHEVERLARRLRLAATPLTEIATEVNLAKRGLEEGFSDLPNTVYLPLIGRSPAVSSLAELQIKPHNYAQLVLDPDRAIATYVANFFNTPLGQKIRESLCTGFIPKISKSRLRTATVYLHDLATQAEIVRIDSAVSDSLTQLEMLRRKLWNQPTKARQVEKAVRSLNPESDFETWMESLPFPLASILWAFHAAEDVERKWRQLIHFFEGFSQFYATVLLSAFEADQSVLDQYGGQWMDNEPSHRDWFRTPSFGAWNILFSQAAKAARRLLSGEQEQRQRCVATFGSPETEFLNMLTSKRLVGVLGGIKQYRDRWVGHGAPVSAQEHANRLKLLRTRLSDARRVVSDHWNTALLLRPGQSRLSEGVHRYTVEALVGTRTPFRQLQRITLEPMDDQKLYLLHEGQFKPMELLPLIGLKRAPKTQRTACYFYNRLDDEDDPEGVRWVSYHFAEEAVLRGPYSEVERALSALRPADMEAADEL